MIRRYRADALAVTALIGLWLFFFWRLFTPVAADQASLMQGDFSGQFVTFAAYQAARLGQGEVPLWNPYNNAGLPFLADTQAAVFYPPRLLTIALANSTGGWRYHALELEMTVHVLACTLLMYAFVRRLTLGQHGSAAGGLAAALIAGYGGFMTGYPPLQLALLEAAIWLPLAALGLLEAARAPRPHAGWLLVSGMALGLSWMAGHPQTSYFLTLLLIAGWAHHVWRRRWRWTAFAGGLLLFGSAAFALSAVQLIPGLEYLPRTARADFAYDAKANGFPIQDVVQFVFPGVVSLFSPLYAGAAALLLASSAVFRRLPHAAFWAAVFGLALLWSFGENGAVYPLLYNTLPGLRFFRGQERAAFLVASSVAVLAGIGLAALPGWLPAPQITARLRRALLGIALSGGAVFTLVLVAWLGARETYAAVIGAFAFGAAMLALACALFSWLTLRPRPRVAFALFPLLIAFELFSVGQNSPAVYEPVSPESQLSMTPPPLIAQVLADDTPAFRVDGQRGLGGNDGSLYAVQDIRGISPLFLSGPRALIDAPFPSPSAWELFSVRYVLTDWAELPIPSRIIGAGEDGYGAVNLHLLTDPRPFAQVMTEIVTASTPEDALALASSGAVSLRNAIVLEQPASETYSPSPPAPAEVRAFAPERIEISGSTETGGVLSLSMVYYPGWQALLNGQPVPILRAYGALQAVEVPPGDFTLQVAYQPVSALLGGIISAAAWLLLLPAPAILFVRGRRHAQR